MFRVFEGRTADEVWQRIARSFCASDSAPMQSSRLGPTREMLHAVLSIEDPTQRWVVSREPSINPAFAIAEVVWILTGRNDAEFLNYFNRGLPRFAGDDATYHGAYGYRFRRHFEIDQLDRAFRALSSKPDSRQVVLQTWDSRVDFPGSNGEESSKDIPCNVLSMLKVRRGKLEWTQVVRSNDVFRGLPYNLVQFTTLQEVVAGWLGVEMGAYNQISDSLHVYDDCLGSLRASTANAVVANPDVLALRKNESEAAFQELACHIDSITTQSFSADALLSIPRHSGLPEAYRNMLSVLCAEAARRQRFPGVAEGIMSACTNPVYNQMFHRWLQRFPVRLSRSAPP